MSYSLKADILKRIDATRLAAISQNADANITQAIADADDEINSYLNNVVAIPLTTPPAMIIKCSVMIAIKNLYISAQFQDIPEWIRKEYEDAIKYLGNVAKGIANLNVATDVVQDSVIEYEDAQIIFRRSSW